jgi:hypothetical protein
VNSPDNGHDPQTAVTAVHATPTVPAHCDECNAPVEEEQRYCVVCGAHRRHVEDPAARYLSELTARSRTKRAGTVARPAGRAAARGRGLGLAVALALVPVAAAVGVVAERSHNDNNAKLIQALAKEQAAADAVSSAAATGAGTSASSGGTSSTANADTTTKSDRTGAKHSGSETASHKGKAGGAKPAIPGGVTISAQPPSQAQKQAGAQATQKVQKAKGKNYVKGQQGLPTMVVVP